MERQIAEVVKANLFCTDRLAALSREHQVGAFIFISTEKAFHPTSTMALTKRLGESCMQSMQRDTATKFITVRLGNVLDSSGSVVSIFRQQIASGGPVTVTHPEATCYFLSLTEAVEVILQNATQGNGGEIFVVNRRAPVKILDIAKQLIRMNGLEPEVDIATQFIGLRPGDTLHDEPYQKQPILEKTRHPRIFRLAMEPNTSHAAIRKDLKDIEKDLDQFEPNQLKQFLQKLLLKYTPRPLLK